MSAPSQTFRVTFSAVEHVRIELDASSAEAAMAMAEALWMEGNADGRFRCFAGGGFSDPYADPVQPIRFEGDEP